MLCRFFVKRRNCEVELAKNTGDGYRIGQIRDRYQQYNDRTDRFDKYDGDGNYVESKTTPGTFKGVEERQPRKPPRG
jgi:hypothetical protein